MSAHSTISKGLSEAQTLVWNKALESAGLSRSEGIEKALKMFVEAHGQLWPETGSHGGKRVEVAELVALLDALMINQDGNDYARRAIPDNIEQRVIDYAVARGYCTVYPQATAAPTSAGEIWLFNHS